MTPPDRSLPEHRLLIAYDAQLREEAEMGGATSYDQDGPLWRGIFGSRGFVTYRDFGGLTGSALDDLIARTVSHYAADLSVTAFEWKMRGHDLPADLPERLVAHGLMAGERETVMLGEAALLAVEVPLPLGVRLWRIDDQADPLPDLVRIAAAQERAFGVPFRVEEFVRRLERGRDFTEFWVAEVQDEVVSTGRLEIVPGTEFAGVWGGGTVPEWGEAEASTVPSRRSVQNLRSAVGCGTSTVTPPSVRGPFCSAAACCPSHRPRPLSGRGGRAAQGDHHEGR